MSSSNIFDKYVPLIEADRKQKEVGYQPRKPGPKAVRPPSKQLNVRIDERLHAKLLSVAYERRTTVRELVENFIDELVA